MPVRHLSGDRGRLEYMVPRSRSRLAGHAAFVSLSHHPDIDGPLGLGHGPRASMVQSGL